MPETRESLQDKMSLASVFIKKATALTAKPLGESEDAETIWNDMMLNFWRLQPAEISLHLPSGQQLTKDIIAHTAYNSEELYEGIKILDDFERLSAELFMEKIAGLSRQSDSWSPYMLRLWGAASTKIRALLAADKTAETKLIEDAAYFSPELFLAMHDAKPSTDDHQVFQKALARKLEVTHQHPHILNFGPPSEEFYRFEVSALTHHLMRPNTQFKILQGLVEIARGGSLEIRLDILFPSFQDALSCVIMGSHREMIDIVSGEAQRTINEREVHDAKFDPEITLKNSLSNALMTAFLQDDNIAIFSKKILEQAACMRVNPLIDLLAQMRESYDNLITGHLKLNDAEKYQQLLPKENGKKLNHDHHNHSNPALIEQLPSWSCVIHYAIISCLEHIDRLLLNGCALTAEEIDAELTKLDLLKQHADGACDPDWLNAYSACIDKIAQCTEIAPTERKRLSDKLEAHLDSFQETPTFKKAS